MDLAPGEYFFHYTTREAAFQHILPSRQLRLSPYSQMRDPLENQRPFFTGAFWDPGDESTNPERALIEFNYRAKLVQDTARLLALTVDADDYPTPDNPFARGWARARMWEHYAEQHRGVCLVFHKDRLTRAVVESLGEVQMIVRHQRVEYSPHGLRDRPHARNIDLTELMSRDTGGIVAAAVDHLTRHYEDLFFLKTQDWRSEYEYRFVALGQNLKALYAAYGDSLSAVIVGDQFPPWQRPAAVAAGSAADAPVRQVSWVLGQPALTSLREKTARSGADLADAFLGRHSPSEPAQSVSDETPNGH